MQERGLRTKEASTNNRGRDAQWIGQGGTLDGVVFCKRGAKGGLKLELPSICLNEGARRLDFYLRSHEPIILWAGGLKL